MWQVHVKNFLLLMATAGLLLISPAITWIVRGDVTSGIEALLLAILIIVVSASMAAYWHNKNIHASPIVLVAALLLLVCGTVWLWLRGFYFWIPIGLLLALVAYGYLTGKNKS
ncbi:MAG: hypothetical protein HYT12_04065 [Candidatus Liptonbacteria bacterium]|nr:hypothetical protein [Candidatus Liptonbacteria bacterium]